MSRQNEYPFKAPMSDSEFRQPGGSAPQSPMETALSMLRQGATEGMVRSHLRTQGLSEHEIERTVETASKSLNLRVRGKGVLAMVSGAILVVISGCLMFVGETVPRLLLFGLVTGGVLFAKGFFSAVSGVESSRN